MRTYSRKKPEYQIITGVEELCRLCLGNTGCSVPLFTEEPNENDSVCALPLRIMICVGLEITREEFLPKTICNKCYKELDRCYTFRKKCEVTYQKLKSHALAIKGKQHQQLLDVKCEQNKDEITLTDNGVERDEMQQLDLTIDESKQMEIVNVVNIKAPELVQVQPINGFANDIVKQTVEIDENIQVQDPSAVEIEASNSDMSMILSTILMELDIVQTYGDRLVVLDPSLKTVEIEGANHSKVVLELLEEDDAATVSNAEEQVQNNVENKEISNDAVVKNVIVKKKKMQINVDNKQKSKHVCAQCLRAFASRGSLARHARAHSGARPHACAACGRRFAQREVMLRHQLVHKEVRPFKCEQCPKSFTQRGALAAHARAHDPPRLRALTLHACPHCDKVFLYGSGLSRHLSTHTGRVFVCNGCEHQFRDKSSLLRHLRVAHANSTGP